MRANQGKPTRNSAEPIQPNNDLWMVQNGLRNPLVSINRSIFEHTISEKRELKLKRKNVKFGSSSDFKFQKEDNSKYNLIVYMKHSPKVDKFKSTHPFKCYKNEVENILANLKEQGYKIGKVYFNNHSYVSSSI